MIIEPTNQDVAQVLHNYRLDLDTRYDVLPRRERKEINSKMGFCHVLLHADESDVEQLSTHRYAEEVMRDIDDEAFYRVTTEIRKSLEDKVSELLREVEDAKQGLLNASSSKVQ